MALDKQMILSELGSVMNKLQSADCGCMGKLFSNQGQYTNQGGQGGAPMGSPLPTCGGCRRGCCHGHGYGNHNQANSNPYAGEPYSPTRPCMGMQCNPHKLYTETYNYLSSNLMKPVVQEVYQDLKSINPANSVVNNPLASQMGLQQQGGPMQSMTPNQMPGGDMGTQEMSMNQQMGNQQMGNQQMGHQQMGHQQMGDHQMGDHQMMGGQQMSSMGHNMAGMGPNILNMMQGDGKSGKPQMTGATANAAPQGQLPGGQYNSEMTNAPNYGNQQVQSQYMQQQNMNNVMDPNSQNPMRGGDMQQNAMGGNMQNSGHPGPSYKVNYSNPAAQQMSSNRGQQNYGKHTPGVTKFNEMFPGVAGGMGGDLGFDPMSIAIQMNPANQQQAAMGTMQKLMNGNPIEKILDPSTNTRTMQPVIAGANAAAAALNQLPTSQQNVPPTNQQISPSQPGAPQQNLQGYTNQPNQVAQQAYGQVPQQQQQIYTATGAPTMNQNQPPQQYQQQQNDPNMQQYQQQQNVDPNSQQYQQKMDPNMQGMAAPDLPNSLGGFNANPNAVISQQSPQSYGAPPTSAPNQQMVKEPIFPVDTSKNQPPPHMKYQRSYQYNTLGQPVEVLPASLYQQAPDMSLPQTLSPQPATRTRNDQPRYTVKNTVSKTSLMGTRPVGRTPSRGQLQHIYNQYKGSHSLTQQNIRAPGQGTFSEGKINVALANENQRRHVPVERVGGDTVANNQLANSQIPVKGQPMGHTGDVPVDNKPHGDGVPMMEAPVKKGRNGLQDMVYSSYPSSAAAWSFHGNNERSLTVPYTLGCRFRSRA